VAAELLEHGAVLAPRLAELRAGALGRRIRRRRILEGGDRPLVVALAQRLRPFIDEVRDPRLPPHVAHALALEPQRAAGEPDGERLLVLVKDLALDLVAVRQDDDIRREAAQREAVGGGHHGRDQPRAASEPRSQGKSFGHSRRATSIRKMRRTPLRCCARVLG
jgi:hypothetical protein